MARVFALASCGLLVFAAGCSSSDNGGGGVSSDAGAASDTGNAGGGDSGGGPASDGSSPVYSGGDVTVSLVTGDGGAVDPSAVTGTVTIAMVPSKPSAIAKIEALVDGKVVGTASQAPFKVTFDSTTVSNGAHTVVARAHDLAGLTGDSAGLAITTSNFLLAGTWKWTGITDTSPGFSPDSCSDTTFTVTFDPSTSTVTLPMFYLTCKAQNGASYSSKINGFSQVVTPAQYGGPIQNTTGTVTTTLSTTKLTQSNSFNNNVQTGTLSR